MERVNYELEWKQVIPFVGGILYLMKSSKADKINNGPDNPIEVFYKKSLLLVYASFALPEIVKGIESLLQ